MNTLDRFSPATSRLGSGVAQVLVVDDEEAVRRYAARVLEREGFAVHQATDGAEALDLLGDEGTSVEVVVSDVIMPRLNGVELLQALASSYPDLPVILMSGYANTELAELGVAVPCGIIAKPFPAERLVEEVRRCIRKRE